MSLTRSVAHNTFLQAIGRTVSIVIALVVFFLVARYLGVEGYGQYTIVNAFLQFFGLVVDLGLYIYLTKSLGEPDVDEQKIVGNIFTLRLLSAAVVLGIAPLLVLLFPYPSAVKAGVAVMSVSFLFVTLTQVLTGVFQKRLIMWRFILGEVLGRVVLLVATIAAIRANVGLLGVFWTLVVSSIVTFALTVLWARGLVRFQLRFDFDVWKKVVKATWPIALSIAFNVIYFKADTIILSLFHSARDVGIYGAPYRVFEALISIPAMFAGLLTPILTTAYATDRARFQRVLQRGFDILLLAAVPLVIGAQFVATDVMEFVSPGFAASGTVLRLLVFGTAAVFLGYLFSNTVVVVNRQRTMMWAYLAVALSSLVLYFLTIPKYSYFGAAGVTVLVESAVAIVSAMVVLRTANTRLSGRSFHRILVAAGVMALAMWFGRSLPWVVNGAIGTAAYAAAILVLGVVDRATIREVFSRSS